VPGPGGTDPPGWASQVVPGRSEVAQAGNAQPGQPATDRAQVQLVPEIQQVAVDPPGRPFPVSPEGLDELHDGRRGALGAVPWDRGTIGQSRLTGGEIADHPGRHRRAADPELGGHVGLRDPVLEVAADHAQPAGRGQGCVNVGHERALLLRTDGVGASILWRGARSSSHRHTRGKNLMPHNS
jgi:hypothetical protein